VDNPFFGLTAFEGTSLFSSPTVSRADLSRPYPHFGDLTNVTRNDGKTWYNSMQIQYQSRYKAGMNLLVSYTLSKLMEQDNMLDEQQLIPQRSLSQRDIPHRISIANVWELPFGSGKRFGSGAGPWMNRLIGGWQSSLIFQYQTGWP
jgi:hypothetical protein